MPVTISQAIQNGPKTYAFGLTATPPPVTQASAFVLPANVNIFTTVAPGSAAILPIAGYLLEIEVLNRGGQFTLIILPQPGWLILPQRGSNSVNVGVAIENGGSARFVTGDPAGSGNTPVWYVR